MKNICILGSTGSIGMNTLDVIKRHPYKYQVFALSAHSQIERLYQQCLEFKPKLVVLTNTALAQAMHELLQQSEQTHKIELLIGSEQLDTIASATEVDYVMAAIVGAAGLSSSLAAAKAGKRIMLANKESLVMSGELFMQTVLDNHAELLPVDSEHNAIFQSLPEGYQRDADEYGICGLLLTASGGPFRTCKREQLSQITPQQACAHPNWKMGAKISVDSATMMNKGLEVIEASQLFNIPASDIEVLIHPQSIIHSMVSYQDGSVIAQMGNPDMRTPIAYALAWPERINSGVEPLDLVKVAKLDFEQPDKQLFPCLDLAYQAINHSASAITVLNAANEVAVQAFLEEKISYLAISDIIAACLDSIEGTSMDSLEAILAIDHQSRVFAQQQISRLSNC